MKRPIIIGAIVVVVLVAIFFAANGIKSVFDMIGASEASAQSVGNAALAAVTKNWDAKSITGLTTPEYQASIESNHNAAWETYTTLGAAMSLDPCTSPSMNITNGNGRAELNCPAKFAKGAVTFDITVITSDWGHSWKISSLALAQ